MLSYAFLPITRCNMCAAEAGSFKTLGTRLNITQGFKPALKTGAAVTIQRCKECRLVFSNPQPIPSSIAEQYDLPPEEYFHRRDIDWYESYFKREIDWLAILQPSEAGRTALDIGAGVGRSMISLGKAGYEVYGFEPSKPFYDCAIEQNKIQEKYLKLGSIEEVEYDPCSFDFITFGAVLEHIHDPNIALKRAMSWLKPGGLLHIEVPSSGWLITKILNRYYKIFTPTNYVTNLSPMHSPFHHFEFTAKSFYKNGAINNYEVAFEYLDVCEVGLPTKKFDGLLKKIMKSTNTGLQLIVYLRKK